MGTNYYKALSRTTHTPKGSFLFAFMMPLETFGNLEVK